MLTQTLTPYSCTIKRYPFGQSVLFICDSTDANFDILLPDAAAVKNVQHFYFQKDIAANIVYIKAQFGQSINGVERISLTWRYHSIMLISDGENYRVLSGVVPELPATWPLGPYWRITPEGTSLKWEKDTSLVGTGWTPFDVYYMNN